MLSWVAVAGLCRLPWTALRRWYQRGFAGLAPAILLLLLLLSLAPIRFQKPPGRDWQTLFHWLEKQAIPPRQLAHDFVDNDEVCYFYLKHGFWLPRFNSASTRSGNVAGPTYVLRQFGISPPPSD